MRPNYGGQPVTVGVTLYVLSVGDLSEKFMDFTFDMYFRQFWIDPRSGPFLFVKLRQGSARDGEGLKA